MRVACNRRTDEGEIGCDLTVRLCEYETESGRCRKPVCVGRYRVTGRRARPRRHRIASDALRSLLLTLLLTAGGTPADGAREALAYRIACHIESALTDYAPSFGAGAAYG